MSELLGPWISILVIKHFIIFKSSQHWYYSLQALKTLHEKNESKVLTRQHLFNLITVFNNNECNQNFLNPYCIRV